MIETHMKWLSKHWFLLLAGCAAGLTGAWLAATRPASQRPASLDILWAAQLSDLRGAPVRMDQMRGKPLIVNFWATWCGPCKEEMPDFQRLAAGDLGKSVQIVGIGIDNPANMRSFGEKLGITYPLLDGGSTALDMLKLLGNPSGGLPYTIVVDRAGSQVAQHLGRISYEELKTLATAAIKQ